MSDDQKPEAGADGGEKKDEAKARTTPDANAAAASAKDGQAKPDVKYSRGGDKYEGTLKDGSVGDAKNLPPALKNVDDDVINWSNGTIDPTKALAVVPALYDRLAELKTQLGAGGAPGARVGTPSDYFANGEVKDTEGTVMMSSSDPASMALAQKAHELGLTDKQFSQFAAALGEAFTAEGPAPQMSDLIKNPAFGQDGAQIVASAHRAVQSMAESNNYPPEVLATVVAVLERMPEGEGIFFLNALHNERVKALTGQPPPPVDGVADGRRSASEIRDEFRSRNAAATTPEGKQAAAKWVAAEYRRHGHSAMLRAR